MSLAKDDDDDDYGDGAFEQDQSVSRLEASAKAGAPAAKQRDILGAARAKPPPSRDGSGADGDDVYLSMYTDLKAKYDALLESSREQDKTINFQKAKIAALQTELEESL